MPFVRIDEEAYQHPKVRAAGLHGRGLWYASLGAVAQAKSDGVVTPLMAKDIAYLAEVDVDLAFEAVLRVGLWHDAKTIKKCGRCKDRAGKLDAGSFYVHDFLEKQPAKADVSDDRERWKWRRKRALLNDRQLCDFIQARDGGLCRYCGERVNWQNKRGPDGATYDHFNPDGWNDPENVGVACRRCNGIKKDRTPEEAKMALRPPANPQLSFFGHRQKQAKSRLDPDQKNDQETGQETGSGSSTDLASRARHARGGTGQVRIESGSNAGSSPGSNTGRAGTGHDGDGDWPGHDESADGTGAADGDEQGTGATA